MCKHFPALLLSTMHSIMPSTTCEMGITVPPATEIMRCAVSGCACSMRCTIPVSVYRGHTAQTRMP